MKPICVTEQEYKDLMVALYDASVLNTLVNIRIKLITILTIKLNMPELYTLPIS